MEWKAVFSSILLFQVSLLADDKRDYLNNQQALFTKVFTEFLWDVQNDAELCKEQ